MQRMLITTLINVLQDVLMTVNSRRITDPSEEPENTN